jgi:hypothetical protein
MAVPIVREFGQFESAFFFAWVFFPRRTENRLLRLFLGLLRANRRSQAFSNRPI